VSSSSPPPAEPRRPDSPPSPRRPTPAYLRLLPALTGIAGLVLGGVLVGVTGKRSTESNPAAPTVTASAAASAAPAPAPTTPVPTPATTTVTATATATATVTASPRALAELTDGTFVVPGEASPGTWSTTGQSEISASLLGCYWARLRSLSGQDSAIIASDNLARGAQTTITIERTDKAVKFTGGCRWRRIA
jgi:glucose/arabinose dehydrogenase